MITSEVQEAIDASVLCWLATVDAEGMPNVSPKEVFLHDGHGRLLIANIASPGSVRNIRTHGRICASFIDVFLQKGFKIQGTARLLEPTDADFDQAHEKLRPLAGPRFAIRSVIELTPTRVTPIIAPSYFLDPDTDASAKIAESLVTYQFAKYKCLATKRETAGD